MKIKPHIIEFQNMGISLYSLRKGAKRWEFFVKGAKPHFGLYVPIIHLYWYKIASSSLLLQLTIYRRKDILSYPFYLFFFFFLFFCLIVQ